MTKTLIGNGNTIPGAKVTLAGGADWCEISQPGLYPVFTVTRDRSSGVRAFKVPDDRLNEFGEECMPQGTPGQHPAASFLFVDEVSIQPFGDGNVPYYQDSLGHIVPESWLCIVKYSQMVNNIIDFPGGQTPGPVNSDGADLYDGVINITNEVMMFEGDGYTWENETDRIAEIMQFPKIIPIVDRELRIPRVTTIPWPEIRPRIGCVNSSGYMGANKETLLYIAANIGFKRSFNGQMSYSIAHKFKERRIRHKGNVYGWNHFWDPKTQDWRKTDPTVYSLSSFSTLIPGVT